MAFPSSPWWNDPITGFWVALAFWAAWCCKCETLGTEGECSCSGGRWEGSSRSIRGVKAHIKLVSHCKCGNTQTHECTTRLNAFIHTACANDTERVMFPWRLFDYNAGTGHFQAEAFPLELWLMGWHIFFTPIVVIKHEISLRLRHNRTRFPQYTPTWTN